MAPVTRFWTSAVVLALLCSAPHVSANATAGPTAEAGAAAGRGMSGGAAAEAAVGGVPKLHGPGSASLELLEAFQQPGTPLKADLGGITQLSYAERSESSSALLFVVIILIVIIVIGCVCCVCCYEIIISCCPCLAPGFGMMGYGPMHGQQMYGGGPMHGGGMGGPMYGGGGGMMGGPMGGGMMGGPMMGGGMGGPMYGGGGQMYDQTPFGPGALMGAGAAGVLAGMAVEEMMDGDGRQNNGWGGGFF
mmetsp:Transcript_31966/g.89782  ORF Transcript_31966/g.89782 Transcript_31966/m.89782 type:complete len:248 (+) Transcript_31966:99-842(+)